MKYETIADLGYIRQYSKSLKITKLDDCKSVYYNRIVELIDDILKREISLKTYNKLKGEKNEKN